MSDIYDLVTLQCQVKSQRAQLADFRSGEKYVKMQNTHKRQIAEKDHEIHKLKQELSNANVRQTKVHKFMLQVNEDLHKEQEKQSKENHRQIEKLQKRILKVEKQRDNALDKVTEKNRELYEVKTRLYEEEEKNRKLRAQLNRDYENSSIPSSMKLTKKKIVNNREKSGKSPGGQPGHKGHPRKKQQPTRVVEIPAPDEYIHDPDYVMTGRLIKKQSVNLIISIDTTEYITPEFKNLKTGRCTHAKFPQGVVNEVNYGGSVKAFALMLNSFCNVSMDKTRDFLSEISDGQMNISKGMISSLTKQFAGKTQDERVKMFSDLLRSPVMNTDCTNARVDGENAYVYICADPKDAMYFARKNKGHKGVEKTPVEDYQGILVHDHDKTFYNYGADHQECLAHVLRYLKDSMQNEKSLTWNEKMASLIRRMIHYRKSLGQDDDADYDIIREFERRYREILKVATEEYEYDPPSEYYKDGYNLYKRLENYMDNHMLFLHEKNVPSDNNLSERLLRNFKRKQKQVMTFRSFDSLAYLCHCMSIHATFRNQNQNVYQRIAEIFG